MPRRTPAPGLALLAHDRLLAARQGARYVAGCDEAGRGCLAGPLVAAAVCLDVNEAGLEALRELDDSKRLRRRLREELYELIQAQASAVAVRVVAPDEIDRDGLHRSNLSALRAAVDAVSPPAEIRLSDHYRLGDDVQPLTRGDSISAAIAAAAIVAKVTRDRLMHDYHDDYPLYGFADHVGYLTPAHAAAVVAHGPSPLHRLSFDARCYAEHAARCG